MSQRRKAREIALKILYGLDIIPEDPGDAMEYFWKIYDPPLELREFSSRLISGTWDKRLQLDNYICKCSQNWSIARMPRVDRTILRMAIYELLYCEDIPPKVAINEAIDLGKLYGAENSGSFINGILDAVYAQIQKGYAA